MFGRLATAYLRRPPTARLSRGLSTVRITSYAPASESLSLGPDDDKAEPPLGPGQVAVKMRSAGCGPADVAALTGPSPVRPPLPHVGGSEGWGEVAAVGPGVSSLREGDVVVPAAGGFGTWRGVARVEEGRLAKVPEGTPPAVAAMASASVCAAHRILNDYAELKEGDTVVITGAMSAVGQALVQLAATRGLKAVCVVGSEADKEGVKSLGASEAVTLPEYKALRVKNAGLVADGEGGSVGGTAARALGFQGPLVSFGASAGKGVSLPIGGLIFSDIKCHGFSIHRWAADHTPAQYRAMVEEVLALPSLKTLRFVGTRTFGVTDASQAVQAAADSEAPVLLTLQ